MIRDVAKLVLALGVGIPLLVLTARSCEREQADYWRRVDARARDYLRRRFAEPAPVGLRCQQVSVAQHISVIACEATVRGQVVSFECSEEDGGMCRLRAVVAR